jgi:GTP 3',8-cyclase
MAPERLIIPLPVLGGSLSPPPRPQFASSNRLIDSHGRDLRELRLSITDRCNFRCIYCMEPQARFLEPAELLAPMELARIARVCATLGVTKVRLTGGEPTLHPQLHNIIRRLGAISGIEIAMITNGSSLTPAAMAQWRRDGLSRLTISLDTLNEERFGRITRSTSTPIAIVAAIQAAIDAGITPVKVNAVIIRGVNDLDILALAQLARRLPIEMRFIEFLPLDASKSWDRSRMVSGAEILACIRAGFPLRRIGPGHASSTADLYEFADGAPGRIGIIASITRPFCTRCTRLRITADGKIRPCLFSTAEWDLRTPMRRGASDHALANLLMDAVWTKPLGHAIDSPDFRQPARTMSAIGG